MVIQTINKIKINNMKNLQSIEEGTWVELLPVELTESQIELLKSTKETDAEAKSELIAEIKELKEGAVSSELTEKLNTVYTSLKPELKEEDVYQLISADFSEKSENVFTGIINCRINGEHKQIRF
jgi:hypothetical protein